MVTQTDFSTGRLPTWCPGCGDFGIWAAIKNALVKLNLGPADAVFVFGIGCNSNMYDCFQAVNFESLHGRPLPLASGIRLVNNKLPVFVIAGDGDALGEGGNHFIHTARRNHDITYIIHDNQYYALTTGQTSPTSFCGFKTKSDPDGVIENPLNPLTLALSAGASFVARGFAGDITHLTDLIVKAHNHKGFSVLDVLQPCVTFNHVNTYQTYREKVYKLDAGYNPKDKMQAYAKAMEWEQTGKIPLGIFYEEERQIYEETMEQTQKVSLVQQPLNPIDLNSLINETL
ncbi:MAG: thiamine pyrophosphate-dependent enzyme [Patescibacteria group bacterium]|nr:thiamine pyrophosphate-dependent enzyme [Patescibacteria group bacterium]